tara:strand:- start:104 stop:985 length:882 start_codon:yes stop_codon:yes gene_type:complete
MIRRERLNYNPTIERKKLLIDKTTKLIVWVIVNIEVWDPTTPQPRNVLPPPMNTPMLPDLPNWAWHEYGMRVGYWRFVNSLKSRKIIPTLALNGLVTDYYPQAVEEALNLNWELMGHGFIQRPMHKVENEYVEIKSTIEKLEKFSGKKIIGWESPGLTETDKTLDVLSENGINYVADWVIDDQPQDLIVSNGNRMLALPYTVEMNDVTISAVQNHRSNEIYERGKSQFDQLYNESKETTKIMAISIHPYLTGVPHRIKYLNKLLDYIISKDKVIFMTGEEIHNWYCDEVKISK